MREGRGDGGHFGQFEHRGGDSPGIGDGGDARGRAQRERDALRRAGIGRGADGERLTAEALGGAQVGGQACGPEP